ILNRGALVFKQGHSPESLFHTILLQPISWRLNRRLQDFVDGFF
mgnify:CR=1